MYTVPNQKVIHITKEKYKENFLQIGIDEWQTACKELAPAAFKLYLYLASNANGFDLALSAAAVQNAIGLKKTAYYDSFKELENKGYITLKQGNIYTFSANAENYSANAERKDYINANLSANAENVSANSENHSANSENFSANPIQKQINKYNKEIIDNCPNRASAEKEIASKNYYEALKQILKELDEYTESAEPAEQEKLQNFACELKEKYAKDEIKENAKEIYYTLVDFRATLNNSRGDNK